MCSIWYEGNCAVSSRLMPAADFKDHCQQYQGEDQAEAWHEGNRYAVDYDSEQGWDGYGTSRCHCELEAYQHL